MFESADDDDLDVPPKRSSGLRSAGKALRNCLNKYKRTSSKVMPLQLEDKELEDDKSLPPQDDADGTAEEASQQEESEIRKVININCERLEPAKESSSTDEGHTTSSEFDDYYTRHAVSCKGNGASLLYESETDVVKRQRRRSSRRSRSRSRPLFSGSSDSEEDDSRVVAVPCAIDLCPAAMEDEQGDEQGSGEIKEDTNGDDKQEQDQNDDETSKNTSTDTTDENIEFESKSGDKVTKYNLITGEKCETPTATSDSSNAFESTESDVSIPSAKEDNEEDVFSDVVTALADETRAAAIDQDLKSADNSSAKSIKAAEEKDLDSEEDGDDARDGAMSRQSQCRYSDEEFNDSSSDDLSLTKQGSSSDEGEEDLDDLIARVPQTAVLVDLQSIRTLSRCTINQTEKALRKWAKACDKPFPRVPNFNKKEVIDLVTKRVQAKTARFRDQLSGLFMQYYKLFEAMDELEATQQRFQEKRELPKRRAKTVRFARDTLPTKKVSKVPRVLAEQYLDTYEADDGTKKLLRLKSKSLVHRMDCIVEGDEEAIQEEQEEEHAQDQLKGESERNDSKEANEVEYRSGEEGEEEDEGTE